MQLLGSSISKLDRSQSSASTAPSSTHQCWFNLLPDELISIILVHAVNSESDWDFILKLKLLRLAQLVSRRWKLITCATQGLWTCLNLRCIRSEHLGMYLRRSGVLPLEVHIDPKTTYFENRWNSEATLMTRIRNTSIIIHGFAQRIRRLEIRGAAAYKASRWVTGSLPNHLPNLHELAIYCSGVDHQSNRYKLDLVTPHLRSLALHGYYPDLAHMPVAAKLERLHITETGTLGVAWRGIPAVLGAYPALRELVLHRQSLEGIGDHQAIGSRQPVVLGMLETLDLVYSAPDQLKEMFGFLDIPKLKVLGLKKYVMSEPDDAIIGIPHLPTLERLTLDMELAVVVEYARQFPSVKHLVFIRSWSPYETESLDDAFGSLVSHWQTLDHPLPLETLRTDGVLQSSLLSLLTTGRELVVPSLRKITVYYTDTFLSEDEEDFMARAEERRLLSAIVELEVYGLRQEALSAREQVDSWAEEQDWAQRFELR